MSKAKKTISKTVEAIKHEEATRKNIPTAEYQSMVEEEGEPYITAAYERRNKDLDPQLVWRGKDVTDWSDLVTQAPPLYIQEKVHPKVLIDELMRQSKEQDYASGKIMADLFADFNGLPKDADKTEFYQHDQHWSNRMILGDSLQVMASLAEREGLRGQVQCIYFDPPYGIKFNSNFQWSTTSRDVKDGKIDHITREPEQVKAFRDTWKDGIHSYLTYLRDRLTVARDLLKDSGSIFVQIGDENVHRVRALMDEVFGDENFISQIDYRTSVGLGAEYLDSVSNYLLWYGKHRGSLKYFSLYKLLKRGESGATRYNFYYENGYDLSASQIVHKEIDESAYYFKQGLTSRSGGESTSFGIEFRNKKYYPTAGGWRTGKSGIDSLLKADRIVVEGKRLTFRKFFRDFGAISYTNFWDDVSGGISSRTDPKIYVVQTATEIVQRCLLMATSPGDLVLDPTCGSGTTAMVAEQWGRRWITIDTSRVSLALARARIMGARYPFYLLADSKEGQIKEAEITRTVPSMLPANNNMLHGFVYERVPHISSLVGLPKNERVLCWC
ncbi:MAG TPA: site-specific DNA-methyltransferase [Hanamia sp.]|nr:site-specific DNA-methyltransferase [Hanamia sp.]